MSAFPALDLVLVACVIASAAAFLAWRMLGHGAPPACHQTAPPASRGSPGDDVILGASLQRGLDRARARKRSAAQTVHARAS